MEEKVREYVLEKYPKMFKDNKIIIISNDVCYFVSNNKDESPLILSRDLFN